MQLPGRPLQTSYIILSDKLSSITMFSTRSLFLRSRNISTYLISKSDLNVNIRSIVILPH
jgi:hypothetical protein